MIIEPSAGDANGESSVAEFDTLRRLLVGPEQHRLEQLSDEIEQGRLTSEELAERLPEAIALRTGRDDHLGRALGPTFETAMRESIRRHPEEMAAAIFPVLGPAIRKAIAETMAGLVKSINTAVEQSLSLNGLKWRIEAWRTGVPYPEIVIKHALVYRVEQAFLIHSDTGILLQHVSAADLNVSDADLISGMMKAIEDFVHDSFRPAEGSVLRGFTVGEHTVQVEAGPRALLALVIRGQAPDSVLRRQQDTLETIHLEFANQLAEFSGDSSIFDGARPLLESCLETVLSTTKVGEKRRFVWMKWALPLLLVIAVVAALWLRSTMRWNHALSALRSEPGIVVVDASRDWSRWNISGLRDPVARQPEAVIAGIGIVPPAIAGQWAPYVSLDPSIVSARSRKTADSLTSVLESRRIMFDAGSAVLNSTAVAALAGISAILADLDKTASTAGATVKLELTGRTDPSGADETNATLAEQRVAAVGAWLASAGIDAHRLISNPVATSSPLDAGNQVDRARINRSVSFKVQLNAARPTSGKL